MSAGDITNALVLGRRRKGRDNDAAVAAVRDELRAAGWKVTGRVVKRKRTLRRLARRAARSGCDVVVAVGGDGAVVRVASSLARTETALAIVPTGTGNLLAGNLGIPHDRQSAIRTVLTGRRRRIDFGRVSSGGKDRGFAVACGIGFDAGVMGATSPAEKLRWGKLAYIANAIDRSGTLRNARHEITLDGVRTTMDAAQVFVANFGRMLPVVAPRRRIRGDDGFLDVLAIRAAGPLPGLLAGWEALTQTDLGESDGGRVFRARAKEVTIDSQPRRLVEADGSVVGRTPVSVSVRRAALTVIVPRR